MRHLLLPALLAFALPAPSLKAQSPHLGMSFNLTFPTGDFLETYYPALSPIPENRYQSAQREGYDLGLGGQFTISFPVDPKLAIRLTFGGMVTNGTNTVVGTNLDGDYRPINLKHYLWSIGGDLQIFTNSAFRHRGTYFLVGLSADFERFDRSFHDLDWYYEYYYPEEVNTTHKSRLGGNIGIGHTFGYDAGARFTLEATFHKTLTGNNTEEGDPPNTDFVRVGFGLVF